MCELTGAKSYDRLVGYCTVGGTDFGLYMMQNSSCEVWEKYDVWNRYQTGDRTRQTQREN